MHFLEQFANLREKSKYYFNLPKSNFCLNMMYQKIKERFG